MIFIQTLSWTAFKSVKAAANLTIYKRLNAIGPKYSLWLVSTRDIFETEVISASEILDYETFYDGAAIAVESASDALGQNVSIFKTPYTRAYDADENISLVRKNTPPAATQGVFPQGVFDGTNMQLLHGDSSGRADIRVFDSSGNSLNSTGNALNVSLRDSSGGAIALAGGNLKTSLFDSAGDPAVVADAVALPASRGVVLIGGSDGSNIRLLKTSATGDLSVTLAGTSTVRIQDTAGNTLNSTSNALNVSLRDSAGTAITLSGGNLKTSLFDSSGNTAVVTDAAAVPAGRSVVMVAGSDGTNIRLLKTDVSGNQIVTLTGTNTVRIQDTAGGTISATSTALNVGLTGANTVKLNDSAGTAITLNAGGGLKSTQYDPAGNVASGTKGSAFPGTSGVVFVGGSDGTNAQSLAMTTGGLAKIALSDGSANAITSTSSALDINIKSVTGTNLPISIAAQTLAAVAVSKTNAVNAVGNALFVQLSDGAAAFGVTGNPVFVNLKDGSGNALTSTSNKLDVGLTGANTVKLNDSAGTAITLSGANLKTSIFDSTGVAAIVLDAAAQPASRSVVMVAGTDGANIRLLATDASGRVKTATFDGTGNSISSTSNAMDVNVKSVTGTNLPISIAAQTLAAVAVSRTNAANTVSNPIFVELSDGAAALGTTGNPVFINLKDGSGNALTSTSNKLDVGLTGANTVKLNDSAGTAITLSGANLKTSIFDSTGVANVVLDGAAQPASRSVVMVGGTDGTNIRLLKTDASGNLNTVLTGTSTVRIQDTAGGTISATATALNVGLTGANTVKLNDSAGTAITLSGANLKTSIFDSTGVTAVVLDAAAQPASRSVVMVAGTDGTNIRLLKTDTSGNLNTVLTGTSTVRIQDTAGGTISATSTALNVGLTGANTVKLNDSAGTAITLSGGNLKSSLFDSSGNAAVVTDAVAVPAGRSVVMVGGTDGTNIRLLATDTSGRLKTLTLDGSGNSITSTSSAMDVNIKSVTGTNLPISIAAQTLAAVAVSKTNAANAVGNAIFVQLSDGAAAFGVTGNPVFVNLKDGSGNALTSTSNKLDVGLTGANTVKLNDSAGTAITLSGANLKTSIFDSTGVAAVVLDAAAQPASRAVVMVAGTDGTNIRLFKTDASGNLNTVLTGTSTVRIQDTAGGTISATATALNVGLTGANTVKLNDSAGTAITLSGGNLKSSLFDSSGNAAVVTDAVAQPASRSLVMVGGTDGTNIRLLATDASGRVKTTTFDGAGNSITSTSNAMDINIKSVTGTNLPISIAAQTLAAVAVSKTNAANAVGNAIFVQLSDGAAALGTTGNPVFVNLKDSAGTAITLSGGNLKTSLFDSSGNANVVTDGVAVPAGRSVNMIGGTDGTNIRLVATDTSGRQKIVLFDVNGNTLAPQKNTAVAGTQGGVLISGSDGTNAQLIHTDAGGDVFTTIVDASNNTVAMVENTTVPGSQGGLMVSGWDGTKSHLLKVSTAGIVQSAPVNRDGTVMETAFGQLKVAEENVVSSTNFADQINPEDSQRYVEGPGTFTYASGALNLIPGTPIGRVRIRALRRMQYVAGIGVSVMISLASNDTGAAGCIRQWGAMDISGLNGYFFQLNGTTLQIVRRSNNVDTAVAAASWNLVTTVTPDTNIHMWEISYQWLGSGRIIFRRDGIDVHTIEYAGTGAVPSTQNPDLVPWVDIQNTSTQGASRQLTLACYKLSHENSNSRQAVSLTSSSGTTSAPAAMTSGAEFGVVAINFRSLKGAANIPNQGLATIKRISVVGSGSTTATIDIFFRKNLLLPGVTWTNNHHANDPITEWNSNQQLTATVSATTTTGAGYGTTVNLSYKITALGAIGETIPCTATGAVSSGNPKKQINLAWSPVTYAAGYNIYRQLAGAGNFVFIGTTTGLSFTDDAFVASAVVPPGASAAEGESFMQAASGGVAFTAGTGRNVFVMRITANQVYVQDFASGKLTLYPGENLMVVALPNAASLACSAIVEWEEGPSVER